MHSEMNGLKTITSDGVSKLRKREKSLLQDQRKDKDAITEMEKKLENANNLIHSLRSSSSRYYDSQVAGMFSNPHILPPSINRLKTPQEHVHRSRSELPSHEVDYHTTPSRVSFNERKVAAQLSTEKELRYTAEEICAGVLANSKSALEERDSEIGKLRSQLFKLSNRKYNGDK